MLKRNQIELKFWKLKQTDWIDQFPQFYWMFKYFMGLHFAPSGLFSQILQNYVKIPLEKLEVSKQNT